MYLAVRCFTHLVQNVIEIVDVMKLADQRLTLRDSKSRSFIATR
jgi:hypothetical protein